MVNIQRSARLFARARPAFADSPPFASTSPEAVDPLDPLDARDAL